MAVISDFKATTLLAFLKEHVASGTTVYTDGLKSYVGLKEAGYQHVARIQPTRVALRKAAQSAVPLADRAIGNLQQWLIGTYHGVSKEQLQAYLDEFVFRHNRRRQPMAAFQTLLGLGSVKRPTPIGESVAQPTLHARETSRTASTTYWGLLRQPDKQKPPSRREVTSASFPPSQLWLKISLSKVEEEKERLEKENREKESATPRTPPTDKC